MILAPPMRSCTKYNSLTIELQYREKNKLSNLLNNFNPRNVPYPYPLVLTLKIELLI